MTDEGSIARDGDGSEATDRTESRHGQPAAPDPADTEHPVGREQAQRNEENEPPG